MFFKTKLNGKNVEGTLDYIATKHLKLARSGVVVVVGNVTETTQNTTISKAEFEKILIKKSRSMGKLPSKFLERGRQGNCVASQIANASL